MESEWTSEMPQWIGWSSDILASAKQISSDDQSDSGNSTVFDDNKQLCSSLLQLSEFGVTSPIWGQEILGCVRNGLRNENQFPAVGINVIKREQETIGSDSPPFSGNLPPWFPLALAPEACPSFSNKAPLLNNGNQLLFYNNTPFLKSSPEIAGISWRNTGFSFLQKGPEKPVAGNLALKDFRSEANKSNVPVLKRPRLDSSAPFTAFKVRKEKLGDRITALQQLVSPFGKTDTASVLLDAVDYIKFLHDQVTVLSTPYMRLVHDRTETSEEGLRSKGLCLVPISTTLNVAKHNTTDFWAPTFGGNYR